jgi:hypothetical protein
MQESVGKIKYAMRKSKWCEKVDLENSNMR